MKCSQKRARRKWVLWNKIQNFKVCRLWTNWEFTDKKLVRRIFLCLADVAVGDSSSLRLFLQSKARFSCYVIACFNQSRFLSATAHVCFLLHTRWKQRDRLQISVACPYWQSAVRFCNFAIVAPSLLLSGSIDKVSSWVHTKECLICSSFAAGVVFAFRNKVRRWYTVNISILPPPGQPPFRTCILAWGPPAGTDWLPAPALFVRKCAKVHPVFRQGDQYVFSGIPDERKHFRHSFRVSSDVWRNRIFSFTPSVSFSSRIPFVLRLIDPHRAG